MLPLVPSDILALLSHFSHFAPLFALRTWRHVPLLIVGAMRVSDRRMDSSVLRAEYNVGLAHLPTSHLTTRTTGSHPG